MKAKAETIDPVETKVEQPMFYGAPQSKLHADPIPGYHQCWMNDESGNIAFAQKCGYSFVEVEGDDVDNSADRTLGSHKRVLAGTKEGGGALYAYLMKIPMELHQKAQAEIQKRCDAVDEAIRKPVRQQELQREAGKFYESGGGVKVQHNSSR